MHADEPSIFQEHVRYFSVGRKDMKYVYAILTAQRHMVNATTIDQRRGILQCTVPGGFLSEFEELMLGLAREGAAIIALSAPPPQNEVKVASGHTA